MKKLVSIGWLLGVVGVGALPACGKAADPSSVEKAKAACVAECKKHLQGGEDLSAGPCLSDALPGRVVQPDWVCDVAHSPRQDVDNQPKNQCAAYYDGTAHHFIEVDPACAYIGQD
jgi:hypothetical protein